MSDDIVEKSIECLANAKLNDTTYEVARDIVLDEIEKLNRQYKMLEELNNVNYISFVEANKVINELEKWLKEYIDLFEEPDSFEEQTIEDLNCVLDKIKELKGSDK